MKASTLFAITIAILLGLGVVAAAKYTGLFSPKAPPPQPKEEPPKVLVASLNLFEGMTIQTSDVRVRDLKPEEMSQYQANKDKYLPPMIEAGALRVLARNVEADQPILREYLQDQNLPDPLNRRLSSPLMRAVNVAVPAERAAGGLIQIGERVDVYLTTRICVGNKCDNAITQTAAIARNLRVIVKRNMLFTALAPVPTDRPINFTLEANPYRAALIEFAKTKGDLTLVPTAAPQEPPGRASRTTVPPSQNDPESKEYRNEDERIAAFLSGELTVSEADLERIFNLKPVPRPEYIQVERYNGVQFTGMQTFGLKGTGNGNGGPRPATTQPIMGYQFTPCLTVASGGGAMPSG